MALFNIGLTAQLQKKSALQQKKKVTSILYFLSKEDSSVSPLGSLHSSKCVSNT